jgi:hypothetical protein
MEVNCDTWSMLNEEQVRVLCASFLKTHDVKLDEDDAERVLNSEPVSRYVSLFCEKNGGQ